MSQRRSLATLILNPKNAKSLHNLISFAKEHEIKAKYFILQANSIIKINW